MWRMLGIGGGQPLAIITPHLVPSPKSYKCNRNTSALHDLLLMEPSTPTRSTSLYSPCVPTLRSSRRCVQKLGRTIYRDISPLRRDLEQQLFAAHSLLTMKRDEEVTLKRRRTLKRKQLGNLVVSQECLEWPPSNQEEEMILSPSGTQLLKEPPIGYCLNYSQEKWPSSPNSCIWCGHQNCPMMCFETFRLLSQDSDGSLNCHNGSRDSLQEGKSIGDGNLSATSASPTTPFITNLPTRSSSLGENIATSTTAMDISPTCFLTGQDVQNQRSPTDWWSSSRTAISSQQSMNPFLSGSQYPTL